MQPHHLSLANWAAAFLFLCFYGCGYPIGLVRLGTTLHASNAAAHTLIEGQEALTNVTMLLERCREGMRVRAGPLLGTASYLKNESFLRPLRSLGWRDVATNRSDKLLSALRSGDKRAALHCVSHDFGGGDVSMLRLHSEHQYTTLHVVSSLHGASKVAFKMAHAYPGSSEVRDRWGFTALHTAAATGSWAAVGGLLSAGADPFALTDAGWSPLLFAFSAKHENSGEVFLLLRAAVHARLDAARIIAATLLGGKGGIEEDRAGWVSLDVLRKHGAKSVLLAIPSVVALKADAQKNALRGFRLALAEDTEEGVSTTDLAAVFIACGGLYEARHSRSARLRAWLGELARPMG